MVMMVIIVILWLRTQLRAHRTRGTAEGGCSRMLGSSKQRQRIPHRFAVQNDKSISRVHWCAYPFVVKARVSSVFCSTSWALALPVAGLALELRLTDMTWRAPAMR